MGQKKNWLCEEHQCLRLSPSSIFVHWCNTVCHRTHGRNRGTGARFLMPNFPAPLLPLNFFTMTTGSTWTYCIGAMTNNLWRLWNNTLFHCNTTQFQRYDSNLNPLISHAHWRSSGLILTDPCSSPPLHWESHTTPCVKLQLASHMHTCESAAQIVSQQNEAAAEIRIHIVTGWWHQDEEGLSKVPSHSMFKCCAPPPPMFFCPL